MFDLRKPFTLNQKLWLLAISGMCVGAPVGLLVGNLLIKAFNL